jgi:hypothetical protein
VRYASNRVSGDLPLKHRPLKICPVSGHFEINARVTGADILYPDGGMYFAKAWVIGDAVPDNLQPCSKEMASCHVLPGSQSPVQQA